MHYNSIGKYSSAHTAWRACLGLLVNNGERIESVADQTSIGSGFGAKQRPFRELRGCSFVIENPDDRIIISEARRLNLSFLLANFLWTISGSKRLGMITRYNRRGFCFSDDGVTLASAFGAKLFGPTHAQFDLVAELLRIDPTTRRAVIDLFDTDALKNRSRDISCALAMQFLLRQGKLDCVVYMRSQSAAMVMPYDIFLFTMLHAAMASRIGCPLGQYTHVSSSLHFYEDELAVIESVLKERSKKLHRPMPAMPAFTNDVRRSLIVAEEKLRPLVEENAVRSPLDIHRALQSSALDAYWRTTFSAFFAGDYEHIAASEHDVSIRI